MKIAVVIPYFQREPGLLHRTLKSIAAQEHRPAQVVVVDDGSPRPAAEEITPELHDGLPGLTVILQANRGIAAARNAALDALREDVSAVAFLDSDDYWEPSHLRRAAAAVQLGADFFFSNSRVEGAARNYFQTRRRSQRELLDNGRPVSEESGVLEWHAGISPLFGRGCPFMLSAVVYRRAVMPEARFSLKYRRACEDIDFSFQLLTRSSVLMFCTEPTHVIGSAGMGTWRNSTWGTPTGLIRFADELYFNRQLANSPLLTSQDQQTLRAVNVARRRDALSSVLHMVLRKQNMLRELAYLLRRNPRCAASWCVDLPKVVFGAARNAANGESYH